MAFVQMELDFGFSSVPAQSVSTAEQAEPAISAEDKPVHSTARRLVPPPPDKIRIEVKEEKINAALTAPASPVLMAEKETAAEQDSFPPTDSYVAVHAEAAPAINSEAEEQDILAEENLPEAIQAASLAGVDSVAEEQDSLFPPTDSQVAVHAEAAPAINSEAEEQDIFTEENLPEAIQAASLAGEDSIAAEQDSLFSPADSHVAVPAEILSIEEEQDTPKADLYAAVQADTLSAPESNTDTPVIEEDKHSDEDAGEDNSTVEFELEADNLSPEEETSIEKQVSAAYFERVQGEEEEIFEIPVFSSSSSSDAGPVMIVRVKEKKEPAPAAAMNATKRGRKSIKEMTIEAEMVEVPDDETLFRKQYYGIGEVARMFGVNTSLIRFWETEFSIIKPRKNRKGDRLFRPVDIKNLHLIYNLLRLKKLTIEGAKDYLKNNRKKAEKNYEIEQSLRRIRQFLLQMKADLE